MKKQCLAPIIAGCLCPFHAAQSQYGYAVLDTNDVSAMFHSTGLIGLMPGLSEPNFFVPKSLGPNGPSPLFSSTLWVGGVDAGGVLHLAAERFQQIGHDYFPGPLGTDGSIPSSTSLMYDQLWKVDRADVERQVTYYNCLSDPDCDEQVEYPGYSTPPALYQWPAHGDVSLGQDYYLAPFYDVDGDGFYDPDNGDVPCVPGDQALFAVFNDNLTVHTESGGQPIGLEVHMTAFSYAGISPALDQTVFIQYKLVNRGNLQLNNTYIGLFNDFDLGCANDDYIQCDVGRNMAFILNGDDNDVSCTGHPAYGAQPPAFGEVILQGPRMDHDGSDNSDMNSLPGYNGQGFNDGVVDNERFGMVRFIYFNNTSGAMGDPNAPPGYYELLEGNWLDGVPLSYGGSGYSTGPDAVPAHFMFPGDSDPLGVGTNGTVMPPWTDMSAGNAPGDRRGVASMGPFTFAPGQVEDVLVAYVYARANSGGPEASVAALKLRVDSIRGFAQTIPGLMGNPGSPCDASLTGIPPVPALHGRLRLFPNPVEGRLHIELPGSGVAGEVRVLDGQGREVLRQEVKGRSADLDTEALAPGVYMLHLYTAQRDHTGRFVKVR